MLICSLQLLFAHGFEFDLTKVAKVKIPYDGKSKNPLYGIDFFSPKYKKILDKLPKSRDSTFIETIPKAEDFYFYEDNSFETIKYVTPVFTFKRKHIRYIAYMYVYEDDEFVSLTHEIKLASYTPDDILISTLVLVSNSSFEGTSMSNTFVIEKDKIIFYNKYSDEDVFSEHPKQTHGSSTTNVRFLDNGFFQKL